MTGPSAPRDKKLEELTDDDLARELARRRAQKLKGGGFLAAEDAGEAHAHGDQRLMLEGVLEQRMRTQDRSPKPCPKCGRPAGVKATHRARTVRTMSGELTLQRHYHYCDACRAGFYPLDRELGLSEDGEVSPKLMTRILDFGVTTVFSEAAERWSVHHSGTTISENLVRRVVQRQGIALSQVPVEQRPKFIRPAPTAAASLLVVQTDGSMLPMRAEAEWKEAKLGVIYREDQHVPTTPTVRGQLSGPRYAVSLQGIDDFRVELDHALRAERADEATTVAWVGDGAPWIWNLCDELCPNAVEVLDFMHMKQHAADCGKAVLGIDSPWQDLWVDSIVSRIEHGRLDEVLGDLRDLQPMLPGDPLAAVDNLLGYYQTNARRMDYPAYKDAGLPIGSGTVESSNRHVLQKRMKLAGQHWTEPGAQRMAQLRATYKTTGPAAFADLNLALAA
jgi:hypothetical protein